MQICSADTDHLCATPENSLLGSGTCLAQVCLCTLKQYSDPTFDPQIYTRVKNHVCSPRSTTFIKFFHVTDIFCFPPIALMSTTKFDKKYSLFRWTKKTFPKRYLVPIPPKHFRAVFPTRSLRKDVRAHFVREEPLGLQCLTMIFAISFMENVSIYIWTI